jgi:hypothetical protein
MNNVTGNQPKPSSQSVFITTLGKKLHPQTDTEHGPGIGYQRDKLIPELEPGEIVHSIIKGTHPR